MFDEIEEYFDDMEEKHEQTHEMLKELKEQIYNISTGLNISTEQVTYNGKVISKDTFDIMVEIGRNKEELRRLEMKISQINYFWFTPTTCLDLEEKINKVTEVLDILKIKLYESI